MTWVWSELITGALPSVFPRINDQVNPFPRRVLLEAMGAFVLAPDEK